MWRSLFQIDEVHIFDVYNWNDMQKGRGEMLPKNDRGQSMTDSAVSACKWLLEEEGISKSKHGRKQVKTILHCQLELQASF